MLFDDVAHLLKTIPAAVLIVQSIADHLFCPAIAPATVALISSLIDESFKVAFLDCRPAHPHLSIVIDLNLDVAEESRI
jgi:hypothetical protein